MPAAAAAEQVDDIVRRGAGNSLPHPGDAVQQGGSGTNWESVQLVITLCRWAVVLLRTAISRLF